MELTDADILDRVQAGDRDAYRLLVDRHSRPLFRLAYRLTRDANDADDVVQEAFLRAYRGLRHFDRQSAFATWLHRIAANCALDLVRARQRRAERPAPEEAQVPAPGPWPDRVAWSGQVKQRVDAALGTLSPQERTAFLLRHIEGQSIEEISQTLGVGGSAAKHSIFRAVQKLRRVLQPLVGTV